MPQLLAPFASIALILLFLPACSTHISGPLTVGTVEQLKAGRGAIHGLFYGLLTGVAVGVLAGTISGYRTTFEF